MRWILNIPGTYHYKASRSSKVIQGYQILDARGAESASLRGSQSQAPSHWQAWLHHCLADKQAQLISTPVTSIMCLQGPPRPSCSVVRSTRRLPSQQRRLDATEQQPCSSLRAFSELTAKNSLTEINKKLNQEYFKIKINKFNHDFICDEFISRNSAMISRYSSLHWIHTWIHYYEFIWFHYQEFTGMNSDMNSYIWILTYDFSIISRNSS